MALSVPNVGEVTMLQRILNYAATADLKLKLFTSNTTPGESDTNLTYTECPLSGYAAVPLSGTVWTIATDVSGTTLASYPTLPFALTQSGTVYGYYVTTTNGSGLVWSERFTDGPYSTTASTWTINVTLGIQLA